MIASKTLTKDQVNFYSKIMAEGNKHLNILIDLFKFKSKRQLRVKVFKFNPCSIKCFENLPLKEKEIVTNCLSQIQKVRDIEWEMLCGFNKLALQFSKKTSKTSQISIDDCYQEALMAIIDAIYSYTDTNTSFCTFVYYAIRNRMRTLRRNESLLSALTNEASKLIGEFERMASTFNGTFKEQEVFEKLKWTEDQIETYKKSRIVCLLSSTVTNEDSVGKENYDYTACRKDLEKTENNHEIYLVKEAYEKTCLTPLEKDIIETFLCPYYGWQEDLAKKNINPKTKLRYTRERIRQLLQIALDKIKYTYFGNKKAV